MYRNGYTRAGKDNNRQKGGESPASCAEEHKERRLGGEVMLGLLQKLAIRHPAANTYLARVALQPLH